VQSAIAKMDDKLGRAAIIENGSPLFTGGTSSGESQIRRYLLEQDLLEAIVADSMKGQNLYLEKMIQADEESAKVSEEFYQTDDLRQMSQSGASRKMGDFEN